MDRVREIHQKAMTLADLADNARRNGDADSAARYFLEAFEAESQAAGLVEPSDEPARSVLLRSAATLALECGRLRDAERLVATALSGEPPLEIAEELRDILERLYPEKRADLRHPA
jgi:hypothetical protein